MFLTNFVGLAITGVDFLLEPSILRVFPQSSSPTSQSNSRLCLFDCLLYTMECATRDLEASSLYSVVLVIHLHGVLADNIITGVEVARLLLRNFFQLLFCELCIYVWTKIKPPRERCWRAGAAAFDSRRTDHSLRKGGSMKEIGGLHSYISRKPDINFSRGWIVTNNRLHCCSNKDEADHVELQSLVAFKMC
jgi:hypothetical protein